VPSGMRMLLMLPCCCSCLHLAASGCAAITWGGGGGVDSGRAQGLLFGTWVGSRSMGCILRTQGWPSLDSKLGSPCMWV
jgi:hypothetical protein